MAASHTRYRLLPCLFCANVLSAESSRVRPLLVGRPAAEPPFVVPAPVLVHRD